MTAEISNEVLKQIAEFEIINSFQSVHKQSKDPLDDHEVSEIIKTRFPYMDQDLYQRYRKVQSQVALDFVNYLNEIEESYKNIIS